MEDHRPILARDIYQAHVDEVGKIIWPSNPQERSALARAIYGKSLVGLFDSWLEQVIDLVQNPVPTEPFLQENEAYRKDKYFREQLVDLSTKQREAVQHLVRESLMGLLFSSLVMLEQNPIGEYVLALELEDTDSEVATIPLLDHECNNLYDELNDWILSFSRFANEILELVEMPYGWQFHPQVFYS